MTTIFLTGDRSMNPVIAIPAAVQIIGEVAATNAVAKLTEADEHFEIVTGDNSGFEQAVRLVLEGLGATLEVVPTGTDPDTDKPAWDTRHEVVNARADRVVFVHTDPLASSIGQSLMKVCGDKVEMPAFTV